MGFKSRFLLALAAPASQIVFGVLLGFVFSRIYADSASGWGDLVGFVVGLSLGACLGLWIVVSLTFYMTGKRRLHATLLGALSVPLFTLVNVLPSIFGAGFAASRIAALAVSALFVWFLSGSGGKSRAVL